jgi:hypothetical protein
MTTIWKYQIFGSDIIFSLPEGATVISFQAQRGVPTIWALVDTEKPLVPRKFRLYETGRELPPPPFAGRYIGTIQLENGDYVLHLFEAEQ